MTFFPQKVEIYWGGHFIYQKGIEILIILYKKLNIIKAMFVNSTLKNIKPYKLSLHKAWELEDKSKALKLDWNEASVPPSPKVLQRVREVIEHEMLNWYPDTGNKSLIEKLANYNDIPTECTQYFASSDALHEYIVRAFVGISDRVLIVGPTYDNFRAVAESNGAQIQPYFLNDDFTLDYRQFKRDLTLIRPKITYIVNPNNPTGTFHKAEDLIDLVNSFPEILFIIDEAYYEFSKSSIKNEAIIRQNVIISRTFSKAFALASFRIGYCISNPTIINILNSIRNPKNVSLFAQVAAEAALDDSTYMWNYVDEVVAAKDIFAKRLMTLKWVKPFIGEGNFIMIKFLESNLKAKFMEYLESHQIFIRDYSHIAATPNCARITIGTREQMDFVWKAIQEFDKKNK
ncbi:MAG: hypothetical protein RL757_1647 [Bacteroidota bacterium]